MVRLSKKNISLRILLVLTLASTILFPATAWADPENESTESTSLNAQVSAPDEVLTPAPQAETLASEIESVSITPLATPASDFIYSTINGKYGNGVYITGYKGTSKEVVVPKQINGVDVVSIEIVDYALTKLDVSACTALKELDCSNNKLTSLNVSNCKVLEVLRCRVNDLTTLNVSSCSSLRWLVCEENKLTSLNVSGCATLSELDASDNQLSSLDLTTCVALRLLDCTNNKLASLNVSKNVALTDLMLQTNKLTALDVSNNKALNMISCGENLLTTFDVTKNAALTVLYCDSNKLTTLDVSKNTALNTLYCDHNYIANTSALEAWLAKSAIFGKVLPQYATITTATLAEGKVGTAYSQTLAATGTAPITWKVSAGSLPAGLTLNTSTGVISGTPTTVATTTFTVQATNAAGSVTKQLSIKVAAAAATKPAITTATLADATVKIAYSQTLAATGTTPITWKVSAGSLPAGLTLNASTGVISGTPTATGSSTFTVEVTNSAGSVTKQFTLKVVAGSLSVTYSTHVQNVGWQTFVNTGSVAGTSNRGLRLEGLKVNVVNTTGFAGTIEYSTHVQNQGWQKAASVSTTGTSATEAKGTLSGTEGPGLRLEAMTMKLTGTLANQYDIYYRVHAQNVGWMGWAKNGEQAGTAGFGLRLEAIQVVLVAKGAAAPANTYQGVTSASGVPRLLDVGAASQSLSFDAKMHIQNVGDKTFTNANGKTVLGTTGEGLRVESMTLKLKSPPYSGSIQYETHIQNIGWQQGAVKDGAVSGTSGLSYRLEALKVNLTGTLANNYDVYYRTHIQNFGWTGWAKNGQSCGSAGYGYRMESMQIVIVPKGVAPGFNSGYFYQK